VERLKEARGKGSRGKKMDQKKNSIFFHRTCGRAMTGPHNRTCGARAVLCGITACNVLVLVLVCYLGECVALSCVMRLPCIVVHLPCLCVPTSVLTYPPRIPKNPPIRTAPPPTVSPRKGLTNSLSPKGPTVTGSTRKDRQTSINLSSPPRVSFTHSPQDLHHF
jgi:hypothetical protein